MAWKDLTEHKYTMYNTASNKGDGGIKVTIQYDDSQDLATTLKIRFVGSANSSSTYYGNGYYIYWKPKKDGTGSVFKLKDPDSNWPTSGYATTTITKAYTTDGFSIPEFWICNTGYTKPVKENSKCYISFASGKKTMWWYFEDDSDWFDDSRRNFKTVVAKRTEKSVDKVATAVSATKPTITDNKDSTFSISAPTGTAGTNNKISSKTLYWRYSGGTWKTRTTALSSTNLSVANTVASETIEAYTEVEGKYNTAKSSTHTLSIPNYKAPGNPGTPTISYTKNRLTIKENWVFSWTAATKTNTSSPVKGYRIRLYKNGVKIPIKSSTGETLSELRSGTTDDWLWDVNLTTITINPVLHDFKAGDTVQVGVFAYTENGKSAKLWSGGGTTAAVSPVYTVQNSGVMRVRVGNTWKEGQVHVRVGNSWIEAESVKIKTANGWKESE